MTEEEGEAWCKALFKWEDGDELNSPCSKRCGCCLLESGLISSGGERLLIPIWPKFWKNKNHALRDLWGCGCKLLWRCDLGSTSSKILSWGKKIGVRGWGVNATPPPCARTSALNAM